MLNYLNQTRATKMRVLVTGASGFLGREIYKRFKGANSLGRSSGNDVVSDLSSEIPVLAEHYDLVVHCAALAHKTPMNKFDNNLFHKVNFCGTRNLLTSLEDSGVPKAFIYISSVAVYGKIKGLDIDESESLDPVTPYARSKALAEEEVLRWGTQHDVKITILRLPLVVGSNPPGNLNAMIKGIKRGYYFDISGGKAKKSMVLATDVADVIPIVANIEGIFNLTDGHHPSFKELTLTISRHFGRHKPKVVPQWLARSLAEVGDIIGKRAPCNTLTYEKMTSDLTFSDLKARKAFSWQPRSVLDALPSFLN
jgi:nucleoside-diphosphate-sugar epimerase